MPELPEVETVKNTLKSELIGLTIKDIKINYDKMILCGTKVFYESLINKTFKDILRLGKYLIFKMDDLYLVSHLRMEGKYFYKDKSSPIIGHEHVIFYLSNNMTLRYHDTRKFGIMDIKHDNDLYNTPPLSIVGEEPFTIDYHDLYKKLSRKNISIKTALLDQSIMSGLGNIYVDEVLYATHISPLRKANSISLDEAQEIVINSINILNKAILYKGTTIRSYTSSLGVYGQYQKYLCVHDKAICPCCKAKLEIIRVNGRGTYYCAKCQK